MRGAIRRPAGQAALGLLLCWTLLVTVLRAVRWPNDFAEAHWLLDYRLGIIKRGLPGELVSQAAGLLGGQPTEGLIAGVSAAIFAMLAAALLFVAWRILVRDGVSPASVITAVACLSSSYVVMAAHLVGYFDHLVALATMAAVALALRGRGWWAGGALAAAVFVHEQALVVGFPALAVAWLFVRDARRRRGDRPMPLLPLGLPLVSFGVLAAAGAGLSPDMFQDVFVRHLESFPFVAGDMHLFVPEWLATGVLDSAGTQAHRFVERLVSRDILILILPTTLALVAFALDRFDVGGRLRVAALVAAVLAPQVLHMAGWDTVRIWTFSILAAFMCAWIVAETCPRRERAASPALLVAAVAAVILNAVLTVPLYDNLVERQELALRLWLYAPVVAACAWLLLRSAATATPGDEAV